MGKLYNNITNMRRPERQRKPNRLRHFDYSQTGWYFVTICTKNREEYFGKINEGKMILNKLGMTANKYWLEIPEHCPNVLLDEFIVMPNHVHGIVVINNVDVVKNVGTVVKNVGIEHCSVPTRRKYGLLSKIIKLFKEACIKYSHKQFNNYRFQWQRSFYDHIIRNEKSLHVIREYIRLNPLKWDLDENHPHNIKNHYVQS